MKYEIHVNQRAIVENNYDIDLTDGAIMDFCRFFAGSRVCRFFVDGDKRYYWISHKIICDQLPILRLKPDSAYRRMKGLCEKSFMEPHPENKQMNASWYAFGVNADSLFSTIGLKSDGSENNPYPPQKKAGDKSEPSDFHPNPIGLESVPPSDENPMYKEEDSYTGINNKSLKKSADATAPVLGKVSSKDLEEKKAKKAPPIPARPPVDPPIVTRIRQVIESKIDGYQWDGKNGKAAKELAQKLRGAIVANKPELADATDLDDKVINALMVMIERTAELPAFYQFSDLPALNSKFNEILTKLKNGGNGSKSGNGGQGGRPVAPAHKSTAERVSNLASMFDQFDRAFGGK